jgi:hypothetical protein
MEGAAELENATKGVMENINAGIGNFTDAVEGIGGDAMLQVQKGQEQITQGVTAANALTDNMKNKAQAWKTNAKFLMAENAAYKEGKSAEDLFTEILPDPVGAITSLPGKGMEAIAQTGKFIDGKNAEVEAGYTQGLAAKKAEIAAEIAAEKVTPPVAPAGAAPAAGGRRRSRKSRKKKRRKSRKKKRKSKRTKRMARKSRRKRRSRRRRRRGGITCKSPEIATTDDEGITWRCENPNVAPPLPDDKYKKVKGGRKSRKSRRRRKRSSKKSRRRRRR